MHPVTQSKSHMIQRGLSGTVIDGRILEHHIRLRCLDDPQRVFQGHHRESGNRLASFGQFQGILNVDARRVDRKTVVSGGDAGDGIREPILVFHEQPFAEEQPDQGPGHIAKANQHKFLVHRDS